MRNNNLGPGVGPVMTKAFAFVYIKTIFVLWGFILVGVLSHFLAQGFPIFKTLFYFAFESALNRFIKTLAAK